MAAILATKTHAMNTFRRRGEILRNANAPTKAMLTLALPCSESVGIPRSHDIDGCPIAAKRHKARRIRCRGHSMPKKLAEKPETNLSFSASTPAFRGVLPEM
jgi:hypothetical protein